MKRLFTILTAVLITANIWAQTPQKISYQAVIRNDNTQLVTNHAVGMQISILQDSSTGTAVYVETHTSSTNINGLVSIEIGGGTPVTGTFAGIDWSTGTYYIKTETDPTGSTNYTLTGTSQILSVPYALHAKTVSSYTETDPLFGAWNRSTGISITASQVNDFQTSVTNNSEVLLNTAKNSYPSDDQIKLAAITGTNTGDQNLTNVLNLGTDAGNKKILNVEQLGIGTATPDSSVALEISSTTKGFLPPRMTQEQRDALIPVYGLMIYNITTMKPNYYNGIAWVNFENTPDETLAIGSYYQGGIIAYILQSGDPGYDAAVLHGLIAAPSDQSTFVKFGEDVLAGTFSGLGQGNLNTINIVNTEGSGYYAAKLCYDLVLNGYSDWYLPSKEELNLLFLNKAAIGGMAIDYYWSSSESTANMAWEQSFLTGNQTANFKHWQYYVRAVRSF